MRKQPQATDPRRRAHSERPGLEAPRGIGRRIERQGSSVDTRLARLEAALFLADEPLPIKKLMHAAGIPDAESFEVELARLRELSNATDAPFRIRELAGGYQLRTEPRYHPWLVRFFQNADSHKLGPAPLEVLAIVAYRQPITRAEVDKVRGVQSQEILNQLVERGLLRLAGRHDSLGRPALYGTTRQFLQVFGLKGIDELPDIGGPNAA